MKIELNEPSAELLAEAIRQAIELEERNDKQVLISVNCQHVRCPVSVDEYARVAVETQINLDKEKTK